MCDVVTVAVELRKINWSGECALPTKNRGKTPDNRRVALIVLGMHRSGTSAVTRVLNLCGAALPGNLVDPAGGKPHDGNRLAGFWESETLRRLHNEMLESAGFVWDDLGGLSSEWFQTDKVAAFGPRLEVALDEEYGKAPLFVVKDPRMCRLVPIWRAVLGRMCIRPGFVIVIRNPLEIAASLHRRDQIPHVKAMLMWLHHFLAAENDTRGAARVFIRYEGLLDDWQATVGKVDSELSAGLHWNDGRVESEVEAFLDRGLRHHVERAEVVGEQADLSEWVRTTFRWGMEAASGESPGSGELDRVRTELLKAEVAFRPLAKVLEERITELRDHLDAVESRLALGSSVPGGDGAVRSLFSPSLIFGVLGSWALRGRLVKAWLCWRDARKILRSGLVDHDFYLSQYPDVARAGIDPAFHYVAWGATERRNPNHAFDTRFYVEHHRDELKSTENPLLHYLRSGADKGLATCEFFDTACYVEAHPEAAASGVNPLLHFLNVGSWRGLRTFRPSPAPGSESEGRVDFGFRGNSNRLQGAHAEAEETTTSIPADIGTADDEVRLIAFYLPQFHPIPENDRWWGKGFTEWTNVTQAKPLFPRHRQPVLPTNLGYYDLRVPEVLQEQSLLAREYGVFGFCFHFYWFSGRRLLERPLEIILENQDLDLRFCVCWANENWTRNWDGEEEKILISQDHSLETDVRFIDDVIPMFLDTRYIRVDGKPLLVVYRPDYLIDPESTARLWRHKCEEAGLPGLHLCAVGWKVEDPLAIGFDAIVEFPPHSLEQIEITDRFEPLDPSFAGHIFDYPTAVERVGNRSSEGFPVYRGVMPAWDNTARRGQNARLFWGSSPDLYQSWLTRMVEETRARPAGSAKLVFINSWNEWAEGAMLEPSSIFGTRYLEATKAALEAGKLASSAEDSFPR